MKSSQPVQPQPTITMSRCKFCRSFCKSLRRLGRYIGKKCGCVRPSPDEGKLSNPNVSVPVSGTIQENTQPEATLPVINCDAPSTVDPVANVPVNGTSQGESHPKASLPVGTDQPTANDQVTNVLENGSSQKSSVSEARTSIIESCESAVAVVQDPESEQLSGAKVVTGLTIVELNSDEDGQVLPQKPAIEITEELEPIVEFASQVVVQPVAVQEESEILTKSTLDQFAYQQYLKQVEEVLQVKIYEELGHGSYGKVFLCKSTQDDAQEYAVKGMMSQYISPKEFRSKWEEDVWTEVKCLNDLKHDNVVLYYDHMFMKHHDYDVNCYAAIKTELLDCTLGNILTERELNPEQVALLGDSLGTVLSWMVDQGYAHHDLKPDNIMFKNLKNLEDFDANFPQAIPKIIDLGFVHEYRGMGRDEARERSFGLGTPLYASPEKKDFKDKLIKWYNPFKSDAYSFGLILLWCLISKREDVLKMHASARNCLDQYRQAHPEVANSPYLTAIELLIHPDPNERMHVRDVIALFK